MDKNDEINAETYSSLLGYTTINSPIMPIEIPHF